MCCISGTSRVVLLLQEQALKFAWCCYNTIMSNMLHYVWYCSMGAAERFGCGVVFILRAGKLLLYQSSSASCLIAAAMFGFACPIEKGCAAIGG